jgi:hypothetical protein
VGRAIIRGALGHRSVFDIITELSDGAEFGEAAFSDSRFESIPIDDVKLPVNALIMGIRRAGNHCAVWTYDPFCRLYRDVGRKSRSHPGNGNTHGRGVRIIYFLEKDSQRIGVSSIGILWFSVMRPTETL